VGPNDTIARLTLIRTGSSTHSTNTDERFIDLSFAQVGQSLSAQLPADTTVLIPGFLHAVRDQFSRVPPLRAC